MATTRVMGEPAAAPETARPVAVAPTGRFRVQWPRITDPRLHVASLLLSVQVLGQVSLGFDLSIAQILVSLGTAAIIELALTVPRTRVIAWPASALLTGNGIALILRIPGTEHGEWFSMRGWYIYAATAAIAVLSKYVVRVDGRPLFNPSNLALVATFLILGARFADPQDLWWGPMSPGLALTYSLIVVGGLVITRRLGLLGMSVAFWAVFAGLMAVLARTGHSMTARWNLGPVAGMEYWTTLALSPEILIFVFFMITDPRSSARGRTAGILYGGLVAVASGVLVAFQSTEYATKVALLSGLVLVCATRPLIERLAPAGGTDTLRSWTRARRRRPAVVVAVGISVVALTLFGSSTVSPPRTAGAVDAGSRPDVTLREEQRPEVTIGDAAAGVGGSFDAAAAQRVAEDVVKDLLVADRAVEASDPDLAATVATGEFLDELTSRTPVPTPERRIRSALVDVVRDPEDFQAVPRLSVTLTGTSDGEPWSATFHVTSSGRALIERELDGP